MGEERSSATPKAAAASGTGPDDLYGALRHLAAVGYQLRAALRGGDRFLSLDATDDHNTGVWLISCALQLADDAKTELDGVARTWKPRPAEAALSTALHKIRTRAHQLHAAVRAADHFLDQEASDDRSTGSWLVACALGLAEKLAGEAEDLASAMKRGGDAGPAAGEAVRRPVGGSTPPRGVTVQ